MARRRIGQEAFGFAATRAKWNAGLDEVSRVIDWAPLELLLKDVCAAGKGPPGRLWRWIGLARTALQGRLTLIGFNLRRATALLRPRSA